MKEERRRTDEKIKELKLDKNAAERQMRAVETEKGNLQKKYDILQQEYDNLEDMLQTKDAELQVQRQRVQELTQENQELRNLLHLVQPIQEGQEAVDSTGQEQLLSLTTEAVQDDSQGLPGKMV